MFRLSFKEGERRVFKGIKSCAEYKKFQEKLARSCKNSARPRKSEKKFILQLLFQFLCVIMPIYLETGRSIKIPNIN